VPCVDGRENWTRRDYRDSELREAKRERDNREVNAFKSQIDQFDKILSKRNAMLCVLLRKLEETGELEDVLNSLDYGEAGVSKDDICDWFSMHQIQDTVRKGRK
jgi:hypothetical protein